MTFLFEGVQSNKKSDRDDGPAIYPLASMTAKERGSHKGVIKGKCLNKSRQI